MKKMIGFTVYIAIISALSCAPISRAQADSADVQEKSINPQQQTTAKTIQRKSSVSAITQTAVQAGVLSSAKMIDQVISYFVSGSGTKYGASLFISPQQPDNSIFSASLEVIPRGKSSIYASASFAPFPGKGPEAVYDTVQYVSKTPEELRKTVFKNIKNEKVLKKDITMLDAGGVMVFLMPAGEGCVVIKKQVVR